MLSSAPYYSSAAGLFHPRLCKTERLEASCFKRYKAFQGKLKDLDANDADAESSAASESSCISICLRLFVSFQPFAAGKIAIKSTPDRNCDIRLLRLSFAVCNSAATAV